MKVGLFIPCYVDAFFPEVGIATLELLERLGCEVHYPLNQTCCGQPMANSGCHADAADTEALFVRNFESFDHIVAPSGSCTHHVREHLRAHPDTPHVAQVRSRTVELVSFLHDVLGVREFPWAEFPHKLALHLGCSTLRGLNTASTSEVAGTPFNKAATLLAGVKGVQLTKLRRPDECCGFGGTFSVFEEPVSVRMGQDKVQDQVDSGAAAVVTTDMSCAMHQQGVAKRMDVKLPYLHIAQVLNGTKLEAAS